MDSKRIRDREEEDTGPLGLGEEFRTQSTVKKSLGEVIEGLIGFRKLIFQKEYYDTWREISFTRQHYKWN